MKSGERALYTRDSISRSLSVSMEDAYLRPLSGRNPMVDDNEEALRWAAIENLLSFERLHTGFLRTVVDVEDGRMQYEHKKVDVRTLGLPERWEFIQRNFKVAEEDNERFLKKLRAWIDKVGLELSTVEVRFESITVEADYYMGSRAQPTLFNAARNAVQSAMGLLGISPAKRAHLTIIKSSRMTLLLGPPSSGETTLLLALAGKIDPRLKVTGDVTYNGFRLDEFVPQKTAAYVSQNDIHIGEMTVKETLDFSVRCQGAGTRYELLPELALRERQQGILPDPEVDLFMKATVMEGVQSNLQTGYTLRMLGLDTCADIVVGNDMMRGISGGQKSMSPHLSACTNLR